MPEEDSSDLKKALFTVSDAVLGAAVLLVLGVYSGAWLDQKFHSAPILSTGLALLGGGLGLARMVIKASSLQSINPGSGSAKKRKSQAEKENGSASCELSHDLNKPRNPFDDFSDE